MVPIDFHSLFFNIMEVNGVHQLFGYQRSSNYFICVQQKKETIAGLKQLEAE